MRLHIIFLGLFIIVSHQVKGQVPSDSLLHVYFNQAKEKIADQDYPAANAYFKKIFALRVTLPDELAYYYGLTLVNLGYYQKGKEALEKYIDLRGETGELYSESVKLISEADKYICRKCHNSGVAEVTDTCVVCKGLGEVEEDCDFCKSRGVEFCNGCSGQGVLISKGNFGYQYSTCRKCSGKGYMDCHVCNGSKKKSVNCLDCKGNGFFKRKTTCNHD